MAATKSSSKKQSSSRDQKPSTNKPGNGRWVAGVKTVSTFPPKVHEGRSHHRQVARFEQGFAQKDQAAECRCLSNSFIARDAASARLGANWGSGLSECSGSRRDKRPTNARERPDRRSKLWQALLSEVNPSSEIAAPVFPRHPGCP